MSRHAYPPRLPVTPHPPAEALEPITSNAAIAATGAHNIRLGFSMGDLLRPIAPRVGFRRASPGPASIRVPTPTPGSHPL